MTNTYMPGTKRSCAVCGSDAKTPLFRQSFSAVGLIRGYTVVICQDCGFGFADDLPEQEDFDSYYRDLSKYEYQHRGGRESECDEARLRDVAATLCGLIPDRQSRILEIGSSTGRLLSLLKDSGYCNVRGLDPSPGCAESAKQLYGVTVSTQNVGELAKSEESFDFLIMVGVLEHIRNLEDALAAIRRILSRKGRIYLDVPDATQFAAWPDAPFQQFSTEHINFFSGTSLVNLMRAHGFEPVFAEPVLRQYTDSTTMPSVHAAFELGGSATTAPSPDRETDRRLRLYIDQSRAVDERIRQLIDRTVSNREPIIVWGTGTHTQRLLATGGLDKVNIRAFVDSNPKYHGRMLNNVPILSPESLGDRPEPILICSRVFQSEIAQQIRQELKLDNEVLGLY